MGFECVRPTGVRPTGACLKSVRLTDVLPNNQYLYLPLLKVEGKAPEGSHFASYLQKGSFLKIVIKPIIKIKSLILKM